MLGGMFGGATSAAIADAAATPGAQVVNIPPVISVNGQVYGAGQTVDLAQVIGPEALAQVRSSLEQLGMGGFASMFGGAAGTSAVMGSASPPPSGSMTQPGPAAAVYSAAPGEVTGSGNKGLAVAGRGAGGRPDRRAGLPGGHQLGAWADVRVVVGYGLGHVPQIGDAPTRSPGLGGLDHLFRGAGHGQQVRRRRRLRESEQEPGASPDGISPLEIAVNGFLGVVAVSMVAVSLFRSDRNPRTGISRSSPPRCRRPQDRVRRATTSRPPC